jgi:hypothetical protein
VLSAELASEDWNKIVCTIGMECSWSCDICLEGGWRIFWGFTAGQIQYIELRICFKSTCQTVSEKRSSNLICSPETLVWPNTS